MKNTFAVLLFFFATSVAVGAQSPNPWGYNTGYGAVYGSFGLAQTMQSMYNVARAQGSQRSVAKARVTGPGTTKIDGGSAVVKAPPKVARNSGRYRPDATVDSARSLADALGETAEERALIRGIYTATKTVFDKEAEAKGWANNVAGGLTFFTVTAAAIYSGAEDPSDETIAAYYEVVNAALDETTDFANVSNRNKQGFNNMLVGFTGILAASYLEAKQNNDEVALANSRKLAGMLIEMVLRTSPENIRIENGRLVMR